MLFHHATLIVIAAVYSFAYIGVIRAQEVSNQTLSLNNTTTPAGGTQTGDASSPGPPGVFSQPAAGGGTSKQMAPPFTGGTTQENTVLGPGENLTNINGLLGMGSQTQNNQTPAMNPESDGFSQTIVSTNPGSTCIFSNGLVTENGVTRQATQEEVAQLRDFVIRMRQHQERQFAMMRERMSKMMSRMFAPGFPFGVPTQQPAAIPPMPDILPVPRPPCLCKSNCDSLVMLNTNLNGI